MCLSNFFPPLHRSSHLRYSITAFPKVRLYLNHKRDHSDVSEELGDLPVSLAFVTASWALASVVREAGLDAAPHSAFFIRD